MDVKDLMQIPPWEWPSNAGVLLFKTVLDKQADESDRVIAAELAGDLVAMNEDLADALLSILRDGGEPEDLRASAAIGLGPVLERADTELLDDEDFDEPESVPITVEKFQSLRDSLRQIYSDESYPKEVRRRAMEAAVRAPQDWQSGAIREAYASGDKDWMMTAVFASGYVRGFETEILEALESPDPEIHLEAVRAAIRRELDVAWPHVVELARSPSTDKPLRLAAIEAVGNIRPGEAGEILEVLAGSEDEELAEAAEEALAMAQAMSGEFEDEEEDDEDDGKWLN